MRRRIASTPWGIWIVAGGLWLAGCGGGAGNPSGANAPAPAPAAAPVVEFKAPVPPAESINAQMVALVDHNAHVLWNVEKAGQTPKTDNQWREVEHAAVQLVGAGTLISLAGTGQPDAGWVKSPDWIKFAQQLTTLALRERDAAHAKDLDSVKKLNGDLVDLCEGCHKEFKPELPSEGIVHPHPER